MALNATFAGGSGPSAFSLDFDVLPGNDPDSSALLFSERVIPGSDPPITYVDIAARQLEQWTLACFFSAAHVADFQTLRGYVGKQGTLTTPFGTVTALLVRVARTSIAPLGETYADAEFRIIA